MFRLYRLALVLCLVITGKAAASPTAEFEAPYAIRMLPGGTTVEISGSFSWGVPQSFLTVLARNPAVRTVRLASPGGHVLPALQVAIIIRTHALDTYVEQTCASACTVAFLGGKNRLLAPLARLGFHQASAPGMPPERFDPLMRATYMQAGVPPAFIDHVLRTPPSAIWFPTHDELRASGLVTAIVVPAASVQSIGDGCATARPPCMVR